MRSEKRKEKKTLDPYVKGLPRKNCLGYVEGDEYKALSGGKYGGYPIRGQTKPYEYSYMHYIFHPYDVW